MACYILMLATTGWCTSSTSTELAWLDGMLYTDASHEYKNSSFKLKHDKGNVMWNFYTYKRPNFSIYQIINSYLETSFCFIVRAKSSYQIFFLGYLAFRNIAEHSMSVKNIIQVLLPATHMANTTSTTSLQHTLPTPQVQLVCNTHCQHHKYN